MSETRGPRVTVCYSSKEELDRVRDTARRLRMSLSAFIRATSLAERPHRCPDEVSREAIHQLSRVGNNLNQIAHWANTHKHLRSQRELHEVLEKVSKRIEELS